MGNTLYTKGFSLLEILVVIGILVLIVALGFSPLPLFKKTSDLNSSVEDGVSFLLEARAKTLSSQGEMQYGAHFESGKTVFFEGAGYSSGSPSNKQIIHPSSVETSSILLNGGGSEVVFKRLTGETDNNGTITFRVKSDTSRTRVITIEKTGVVSVD